MASSQKIDALAGTSRIFLILGVVFFIAITCFFNQYRHSSPFSFSPFLKTQRNEQFQEPSINPWNFLESLPPIPSPSDPNETTNLSHLVFGLVGSENAWHHRKQYIESWWKPNVTRGFLFLDAPPTGDLVPWSPASPPYKISDDLTQLLHKTDVTAQRIIHGIMETFREDHENMRWLVMGDDDTILFLENLVDVLAQYDHTKYYYVGGHSEFVMSNFWYSFNQGFGGAGFILSQPLATALARDMENCLKRYSFLNAADQTTMACIADIGVGLTALKGIHQIDLRGDISGFLSSHPKSPLISLHHFDSVEPIFPSMNRAESTRHLMKAAEADQSRLLQQTMCHFRKNSWTFSVSWGYSTHIYEKIMPRSFLQMPIETFDKWSGVPKELPFYMMNTRMPTSDPCDAPHVFYFRKVKRMSDGILTVYTRASKRGLPACAWSGGHSADGISEIHVSSPATKRKEMDRCECCDVVKVHGSKAEIKFRECMRDEIIA